MLDPRELFAGRQVAAEQELQKVAAGCMSYGEELALIKIAKDEMEAKKENEEDEKEEKGESPALNDEEKKEASAMGLFAAEAYLNKMASAGDLIYGDATVYLRKLAQERGAYAKVAAMADGLRAGYEATKGAITRGYGHTRDFARDVGSMYTSPGQLLHSGGGGRTYAVKGVAGALPGAAVGAATGAAASDEGHRGSGAALGALGGSLLGAGGAMSAGHARNLVDRGRNALTRRQLARTTNKDGKYVGKTVTDTSSATEPRALGSNARRAPEAVKVDASEYSVDPLTGGIQSVASGSMLDLLIASRDSGILSQY